ncbi:Serotransferrin [Manis pentadactyla]|nr:Serotransferrin [Manis pentadactyla]
MRLRLAENSLPGAGVWLLSSFNLGCIFLIKATWIQWGGAGSGMHCRFDEFSHEGQAKGLSYLIISGLRRLMVVEGMDPNGLRGASRKAMPTWPLLYKKNIESGFMRRTKRIPLTKNICFV